jgi:L-iditol 2-dehydrogenase
MRQAVCRTHGQIDVVTAEPPRLEPGDLLVRLRLCGVCGTDLMKVYDPTVAKPVQIGHEVVGEVVAAGAAADPAWIGRRVTLGHHVPDYSSHYARRGSEPMDAEFKRTNIAPGGFAEYIRVPALHVQHTLQAIPDAMPDKRAVFVEPMACCLRALDRAPVMEGDTVLVVGVGAVGMLFVPLLLDRSARVVATDLRPEPLAIAAAWGAQHAVPATDSAGIEHAVRAASDGRGADLVILTVVNGATLALAMAAVRDGGALVLFGAKPDTDIVTDYWAIWRRELNIISSYSATPDLFPRAMAILARDRYPFEALVTHVRPLAAADEAFRLAHGGQAMKVVVTRD